MCIKEKSYRSSHWKQKNIMLSFSAGSFKDIDEAIRYANAIRKRLVQMSKKRGYIIDAVIGVSQNTLSTGDFEYKKTGKPGRPKKVFVVYPDKVNIKQPDPHIHIYFKNTSPADMICNELIDNFIKRYKGDYHKKTCKKSYEDKFKKECNRCFTSEQCKECQIIKNGIDYVINQSKIVRKYKST